MPRTLAEIELTLRRSTGGTQRSAFLAGPVGLGRAVVADRNRVSHIQFGAVPGGDSRRDHAHYPKSTH